MRENLVYAARASSTYNNYRPTPVNALEECITAIGQWMSANRLKLNAEKTDLMWAGTRYSVANLLCDHDLSPTLGADIVKATDVIRMLGVLFTPDLAPGT